MSLTKPLSSHSIFEKFLPLLNEQNTKEFERVVKREIMETHECSKVETVMLYEVALALQRQYYPDKVKVLK